MRSRASPKFTPVLVNDSLVEQSHESDYKYATTKGPRADHISADGITSGRDKVPVT
jgi:hypothetical protein